MAESSYYAETASQIAINSSSSGRIISISFESDNVRMAGGECIKINGAKLRDVYRRNKMVSQLLDGVVLKVLGGARDDQDVQNIKCEYFRVLVQCFTDERFVDLLADYDSGRMKNGLKQEFLKLGLDVPELQIVIDNQEDVNVHKARILNRSLVNKDLSEDMKNVVISAAKSDLNENIQVIVSLHVLLRMNSIPKKSEKFAQVSNHMEDVSTLFQIEVEQ